ncbi:hypothetical protein HaLaN_02520, partial [Haematococcus lacustris]
MIGAARIDRSRSCKDRSASVTVHAAQAVGPTAGYIRSASEELVHDVEGQGPRPAGAADSAVSRGHQQAGHDQYWNNWARRTRQVDSRQGHFRRTDRAI